MIPTYVSKLDFKTYYINVKAQKIYKSIFLIVKIVFTSFQIEDKLDSPWFFQKSFFLINISIKLM